MSYRVVETERLDGRFRGNCYKCGVNLIGVIVHVTPMENGGMEIHCRPCGFSFDALYDYYLEWSTENKKWTYYDLETATRDATYGYFSLLKMIKLYDGMMTKNDFHIGDHTSIQIMIRRVVEYIISGIPPRPYHCRDCEQECSKRGFYMYLPDGWTMSTRGVICPRCVSGYDVIYDFYHRKEFRDHSITVYDLIMARNQAGLIGDVIPKKTKL